MISVSADEDLEPLRKAIARRGMTWPQIADGKGADTPIARLCGVDVGAHFVIGRDGRIAGRHEGAHGVERLSALVEKLLSAP